MTIGHAPSAFPLSEYLRRLAAVKAEMARREIDALLVRSDANITYLTGYTARSGYVAQGLVVLGRAERPTFVLRRQDAPAALHQTYLTHLNVIGYPEDLIGNPERDGFDTMIELLHDVGVAERGVGLELGLLSAPTVSKFRDRLPRARIVDSTGAVDWIRGVKSDLEIAGMREAAAIADAGMQRAAEVIRPGVREADAVAEIVATLIRGVNDKVGTMVPPVFLCSTPRTGTSHIPWSEDVFREGSQINLELAGVRHGYTAALMRTFSIGAPSDRLRRLHEAEVAGMEAALATVRPGATCSDVARAFYRTIEGLGFTKESRCGYAIGIDWTEPTASLKDGDLTELKPNMTFHLMLGNWIDEDFGYVLSETFRVTESGAEPLTRTPRHLVELP